jgi:3-methyladenine DNA glycosylase/8-oxoguanine DNA glycosylase
MLNLPLNLSDFYRLCRGDPVLRHVPRVGAGRFLSCGSIYEDVFKAICTTNIGWKQAVGAVGRIGELGEPVRGIRAFPSPQRILSLGQKGLSDVSRLGYRIPYLLEWSERALSGDPRWEAAEEGSLEKEELRDFLLSIRGVGHSTCHYLLMMQGFGDEIPIDSSARLFLRETRFQGRNPTSKQISRVYERFGAWKAHAYWFEFLPWARKHWGLSADSPLPRSGSWRGR